MLIEKEIAKIVGINKQTNPNRQIIINGVAEPQTLYLLTCPNCGKPVVVLDDPRLDRLAVYDILNNNTDNLYNNAKYCPQCGQKLKYERGERVDIEVNS